MSKTVEITDFSSPALDVYARYIFAPVRHVSDALSFRTQEHLRRPPTDGLAPIHEGEAWGGLWQNVWLSLDVTADGASRSG